MTTSTDSTTTPDFQLMKARYQAVLAQVREAEQRAGRPAGSVTLIAVGKTYPEAALDAVYAAGARDFGENYIQEGVKKIEGFEARNAHPTWHFIGQLQSNKTKEAVRFDWVHSVDRFKIAKRLSDARTGEPLNLLIEVNVDGEAGKGGVAFDDVPALARDILTLPNVRLRGLMAIPDPKRPDDERKAAFKKVAACLAELKVAFPDAGFDTLSMGMSHDLDWAIEAGATMVRVGTAIFGPRQYPTKG